MINTRRGLCGYKHVFWKAEDRTRNICALINRWRAVVDRFTFESEERKLEIMSWSGTSPQFWTESEGVDSAELLNKSCEDILHIQDAIQRRKRTEFRRLISHYTRLRERNFKKGIIVVAIRAVSGKVVNSYDMKAMRIDDETMIADDDLIMDKMLEWFLDWHKSASETN